MKQVSCKRCGNLMPAERLEVDLVNCSSCTDQTVPIAFNVFSHKTAPEIMLVRGKENIRQAVNANIRKR